MIKQETLTDSSLGLYSDDLCNGTTLRYESNAKHDDFGLVPSLQTPLDEQATCHFLSHYVLLPQGNSMGMFHFILPLLKHPKVKGTPLPTAFAATTIAALAGRPGNKGLLAMSRVYYTQALKEVNEAVRDAERARDDFSLASVILLSFYEASREIIGHRIWRLGSLTIYPELRTERQDVRRMVKTSERSKGLGEVKDC